MRYEYTVIPAPTRGEKTKDARTATDRYAVSVASELNKMAARGWEYVRADVLPSEERSGLTGRSTVYHNLLVFRRESSSLASDDQHPQPEYPVAASPVRDPEPAPAVPESATPLPADQPRVDGEAATPPAPRTAPNQPN